ncbi:MAG: RsmE family RNA methyltransferase [Alphaproteobacteria bacterium]
MMQKSITKLPRLYTELDLACRQNIELSKDQAHYLKNVMRKEAEDDLRVFNGRQGEWLCTIKDLSKKSAHIEPIEEIRGQKMPARRIHGFFPPIKKNRQDFLIEKAVELGVTDLHPVLMEHSEVRKINEERIRAQIIEASEQCERLDIPLLHPVSDMKEALANLSFPVLAALERYEGAEKQACDAKEIGVIVGPEGGFSENEKQFLLQANNIHGISLGENILRAETAFLKILCTL